MELGDEVGVGGRSGAQLPAWASATWHAANCPGRDFAEPWCHVVARFDRNGTAGLETAARLGVHDLRRLAGV